MLNEPLFTDATTMESISQLARQLSIDYPSITFAESTTCAWDPTRHTVFFHPQRPASELLHELGHALLGHIDYTRDIELLRQERDAWEKAQLVAPQYGVTLAIEDIEQHIDTYRDWLHRRSTCPSCGGTGVQSAALRYACPTCQTSWRVNEARQVGLKRTRL